MIDLTTGYLGLKLRSPIVVSASPLAKDIANLQRMEDAGAGAVVSSGGELVLGSGATELGSQVAGVEVVAGGTAIQDVIGAGGYELGDHIDRLALEARRDRRADGGQMQLVMVGLGGLCRAAWAAGNGRYCRLTRLGYGPGATRRASTSAVTYCRGASCHAQVTLIPLSWR